MTESSYTLMPMKENVLIQGSVARPELCSVRYVELKGNSVRIMTAQNYGPLFSVITFISLLISEFLNTY